MTDVNIIGLRKSFAGTAALAGVSLDARAGELITLLGPSGCGKTTTLRCLAGFVAPDGGEILVDGADLIGVSLRRRNFGMVFQNYALFPHMTVAENVGYGLLVRGVKRAERSARVRDALSRVGLETMMERLPRALSGGQQQRVALARALVIRPRLLLLDEPLANLDARLRQDMRALVRAVQQEHGITAFYVTHDQAEAMAISDRVAVMEDGRVAQFGQPREIYRRPRSASVATFTGEATLAQVTVLGRSGEGCYRVALGSGDAEASGPPGIAAGARRTLMLRPESVLLADTGLPARVEACTFTGAALQCAVRLGEAGLTLLAGADQAIAPGQTVQVQIDPSQAWLIPETAA